MAFGCYWQIAVGKEAEGGGEEGRRGEGRGLVDRVRSSIERERETQTCLLSNVAERDPLFHFASVSAYITLVNGAGAS